MKAFALRPMGDFLLVLDLIVTLTVKKKGKLAQLSSVS